MNRKSLFNELLEIMESYLSAIDSGEDKHYLPGVFDSNRAAARYAVANIIGYAKALKETRDSYKKDKLKRKLRKQIAEINKVEYHISEEPHPKLYGKYEIHFIKGKQELFIGRATNKKEARSIISFDAKKRKDSKPKLIWN